MLSGDAVARENEHTPSWLNSYSHNFAKGMCHLNISLTSRQPADTFCSYCVGRQWVCTISRAFMDVERCICFPYRILIMSCVSGLRKLSPDWSNYLSVHSSAWDKSCLSRNARKVVWCRRASFTSISVHSRTSPNLLHALNSKNCATQPRENCTEKRVNVNSLKHARSPNQWWVGCSSSWLTYPRQAKSLGNETKAKKRKILSCH